MEAIGLSVIGCLTGIFVRHSNSRIYVYTTNKRKRYNNRQKYK